MATYKTESEVIAEVIRQAQIWLGYREKKTNAYLDDKYANAGKNNYTRFARDLDACTGWMNGHKQGREWCTTWYMITVKYAVGYPLARLMLYQPEKSLGAGCPYAVNYYKRVGRYYQDPKAGDQIFFQTSAGKPCHTGLVERVEGDIVHTIEGNTNNLVGRQAYLLTDKRIHGYGRPDWGLAIGGSVPPDPSEPSEPTDDNKGKVIEVQTRQIEKGDKGAEVKSMQILLIGYGFDCGKYGADGDFGKDTDSAVRKYQKDNGLTVDGICGVKTWTKLING